MTTKSKTKLHPVGYILIGIGVLMGLGVIFVNWGHFSNLKFWGELILPAIFIVGGCLLRVKKPIIDNKN
jgi:hypothetical protein